jgi:antitoxin VapB
LHQLELETIVKSELEIKTNRLTKMLADENLDGVLMNTQHNFSWLSGGGSNGIDLSRENGTGFLLVRADGRRALIANNIERARLFAEEVSEDDFEPIEITWQSERDPNTVLSVARSFANGDRFGCDIGFPETRWIEPSIAGCRHELTEPEIARFRDLGRDAGIAVRKVTEKISPGLSETEIARIVRDSLAAFDIYSVVTLVAADDRIAKYRHPVATGKVWNDTVMIVVCARRHGLIASLTRIVCSSAIPPELERRTVATAAVNAALYASTQVGATGADLYNTAVRAYADQGFPDEIANHHQGGAAGYRTREWVAHPSSTDVVRPNQAFAWNPSITGTKTEETALLIEGKLEIVTASPDFPVISTNIGGREYFSPGIFSLSKGASA